MADVFTKEKRSAIMSSVRSQKNKSTELRIMKVFSQLGIHGWRRNYQVKGHPDFVFPDKRIAVFVDGCFWHGHDCRQLIPTQNSDYWDMKRAKNIEHDKQITELFEKRGWIVIRVWECELQNKKRQQLIEKLKPLLDNSN